MNHQKLQVPKNAGILNVARLSFSGVGFTLHKLYKYSLFVGEDSSFLGTLNVWCHLRYEESRDRMNGRNTFYHFCYWLGTTMIRGL